MDASRVSLLDGVLEMSLATVLTGAAVLGGSLWVAGELGEGLGVIAIAGPLVVGGTVTLLPISAWLALRWRNRPLAAPTAATLFVIIVPVLFVNLVGLGPPANGFVLVIQVVACCLVARAFTIWRARQAASRP